MGLMELAEGQGSLNYTDRQVLHQKGISHFCLLKHLKVRGLCLK